MEARATQLAESRPQLDSPLRVGIPINAPERAPKAKSDELIRANTFSPQAFAVSKKKPIEPNQIREISDRRINR